MDYVDIPAHQMHLQAKDGMVGTFVGKDESYHITVSNPHKALTKEHMAALVHSPITREPFAQMRVHLNLISTAMPSAKCNWMKDGHQSLGHKIEVRSRLIGFHSLG
jgi:hypothetical protein